MAQPFSDLGAIARHNATAPALASGSFTIGKRNPSTITVETFRDTWGQVVARARHNGTLIFEDHGFVGLWHSAASYPPAGPHGSFYGLRSPDIRMTHKAFGARCAALACGLALCEGHDVPPEGSEAFFDSLLSDHVPTSLGSR